MTVDREQIRRDIERFRGYDGPTTIMVHHCLALLAELEQAEAGRDNATDAWQLEIKRALDAEARLAKVPALVEAAKRLIESEDSNADSAIIWAAGDDIRAAIAEFEGETA